MGGADLDCDASAGYSGSPKAAVCSAAGQPYATPTGCTLTLCIRPAATTGYTFKTPGADLTLAGWVATTVGAADLQCDADAGWTGTPSAIACNAAGLAYTPSGCTAPRYTTHIGKECKGRNELFDDEWDAGFEACEQQCDDDPTCISFEFWPHTNPWADHGGKWCTASTSCTASVMRDSSTRGNLYVHYVRGKEFIAASGAMHFTMGIVELVLATVAWSM